jgi:hypothetical protein
VANFRGLYFLKTVKMDKLQWFKFTPSDYMMGKIQRCPEITQARFMRLCCLYWNKQCELTYEDAEIEIDKEHIDVLISKRVVVSQKGVVNISFLDEQFAEIEDESEGKKTSGIIGNLKRWHREIYDQYKAKKISLEQAQEMIKQPRTPIAHLSHPDGTPIADPSQSIAEKKRLEQIRLEEEEEEKRKNLPPESGFSFKKELLNLGIEKQIIEDWLKVRKTKKAANTQTAFEAILREIEKSGLTPNECIKKSVENSWSGFKNEWLKNASFGKTSTTGAAHVHVEKKRTPQDWLKGLND